MSDDARVGSIALVAGIDTTSQPVQRQTGAPAAQINAEGPKRRTVFIYFRVLRNQRMSIAKQVRT